MALGHTRQKYKKGTKPNKGDVNHSASSEAAPTTVSIPIVDEVSTESKTKRIDQSAPEIQKDTPETALSTSNVSSLPSPDVSSLDIGQKDQPKSKSARKRAASKRKKQDKSSIEYAVDTSSAVVDEAIVHKIESGEHERSIQSPQVPVSLSNEVAAETIATGAQLPKKQKKKAKVYTKEEKAEHALRKKELAQQSVKVLESSVPAPTVDSTESPKPPASTSKKAKKNNKRKKSVVDLPIDSQGQNPIQGADYAQSVPLLEDSSASQSIHDEKDSRRLSNPPPSLQVHARQKSMDVRLHLNGKQHKSVPVEAPRQSSTSPRKDFSDHPVKVRLPGRDATLVYQEETRRTHAKHIKHRSQATSISSQASGQSKASLGMRSRQSSHTTVGMTGALESKLQNMILSHASDSTPAMTATESMVSQPTDSARSSSPVLIKAASQSAPPAASSLRVSRNQSPIQAMPPGDLYHQSREKDIRSPQIGQIPPVPTVFETRSSQIHAPPSLGPPQLQNLPEQIPSPYHYNQMTYPSNSHNNHNGNMAYANSYPLQSPYYNFYPAMPPPQPFNPYNNYTMGMQMPLYDEPINGTVYYNTDGTPMYPQEYYSGSYMMPDMYQHQPSFHS